MLADVQTRRIALAQIAPRLGSLEVNLATHHGLLDDGPRGRRRPGRLPRTRADRLPAPGSRLGSRDASRRPAPREAGRRDPWPLGGRLVRRGIGRPPAVHRRRPDRGRRDPARPPQALPADLRPLRRAPVLRRRRRPAVGPVAAGGRDRDRGVRGLLAPVRAADPGARRGADPDQRVVVAGPRPGGDQRGRSRDRDLVADPDADLRPADDLVRDLLQPGRRRRIDLVLGRFGGHRARAGRPSSARRSTTRGCTSSTSRPPTSGANGSRSRSCATSGSSCRSAS